MINDLGTPALAWLALPWWIPARSIPGDGEGEPGQQPGCLSGDSWPEEGGVGPVSDLERVGGAAKVSTEPAMSGIMTGVHTRGSHEAVPLRLQLLGERV